MPSTRNNECVLLAGTEFTRLINAVGLLSHGSIALSFISLDDMAFVKFTSAPAETILKWVVPDGAETMAAGLKGAMLTVSAPVTLSIEQAKGALNVVSRLACALNPNPFNNCMFPFIMLLAPRALMESVCITFSI